MFTRQKFLIIAITLMFISSFAIPIMARDRSRSSGRSETQRTEERTEGRTERKSRTERTGRIERTERKERTERRERKKKEAERRKKSVEKARVEHKRQLRPEEIKFRRSSEKVQMATKRTFLSPWSKKVTGTRLGSFNISREEEVSIIIWSKPLPTKLAKRSSSQTEPVSIIVFFKPKGKQMRATHVGSVALGGGGDPRGSATLGSGGDPRLNPVSIILWSKPLPRELIGLMEPDGLQPPDGVGKVSSAKSVSMCIPPAYTDMKKVTHLGATRLPNGDAVSIIVFLQPLPTELRGESNPQPSPSPVTLKRYSIPSDSTDAEKKEVEKKVDATHLVSSLLPSGETVSIIIQCKPLPTELVGEANPQPSP